MARAFRTWTVLPHGPVEQLESNLRVVVARMPNGVTQRVMCVARLTSDDGGGAGGGGRGRLLVHNAIALDEPAMKDLEAWGAPSFMVVPNPHHRQDAFIWKQRYPSLVVACPRAIKRAVERVVKVDAFLEDLPSDPRVHMRTCDGTGGREGFLEVDGDAVSRPATPSGAGGAASDGGARDAVAATDDVAPRKTFVFTDVLFNVKKLGGWSGFTLSPTGCLSVPRITRIGIMRDRRALKAQLLSIAESAARAPAARVIVAHGRRIDTDAAAQLRAAAERL